MSLRKTILLFAGFCLAAPVSAQRSVAREWNEVLLEAIRNDFARPTIHARNLFHTSIAMYDAWAAYDETARTFLLGQTVGGYDGCDFTGVPVPDDVQAAREEAISYAAYRLLTHRFRNSPAYEENQARFDSLFLAMGYNPDFEETDYTSGVPATLGNYIGYCLIEFGLQDGSNERNGYENQDYRPSNSPLILKLPGSQDIQYPNRWQPLAFELFIDQSGNPIPGNVPPFLGPEWGIVTPFALSEDELTEYDRSGFPYWVYHDPGAPPHLDSEDPAEQAAYHQNFALVAIWSGHLDPSDGVMWDISPASLGNNPPLPQKPENILDFYDILGGGDQSRGYDVNPRTGEPYEPQIVPRGDYTRAIAEFWADGPDSETPPGHWFTIANYVSDHPLVEKRFKGEGPVLDDLEWDVKIYFTLGGAVHDAAVCAWGIKGWYDYVRPISAIRLMCDRGQSSNAALPNYDPTGIPLYEGWIEMVEAGDPLAGPEGENIGKIKLYAWRGHDYIDDPETDEAGVGWILAENWWPYQRPTFVTPPFAGYISGHSTFSRAASEVMTFFTGDPFFPGGLGEWPAPKNEFLVFEEGPSVDLTLQWATYRDASDQTSLSRIWGGIHPPVDDMPGRHIGIRIGADAFQLAEEYFTGKTTARDPVKPIARERVATLYPNPILSGIPLAIEMIGPRKASLLQLFNAQGQLLRTKAGRDLLSKERIEIETMGLPAGIYMLRIAGSDWEASYKVMLTK
jgi:hypothetical protein